MKYFSTAQMQEYLYNASNGKSSTAREGTISTCHIECRDTRNRLYITPTSDDKFLFYCHNCGTRGCLIQDGDGTNLRRRRYLEKDADYPLGVVEYNERYWPMLEHCNPTVAAHLSKYVTMPMPIGVPQKAFKLSGGKCFVECGGVLDDCRPVITFCTGPAHGFLEGTPTSITEYKFAGMQRWKWEDGKIVKRSSGKMSPALFYNVDTGVGDKLLVICEDPISAMCIVEAGADALCLFGTNITNHSLCDYSIRYDSVLVWLDLDSDHNCTLATHFVRTCQLVIDKAANFRDYKNEEHLIYRVRSSNGVGDIKHDPKNYQHEYMKAVFETVTDEATMDKGKFV